jgi:hypothetical protein
MLLDHDILIDAGTGVGDLSIDELARNRSCVSDATHIWTTVHFDSVYAR